MEKMIPKASPYSIKSKPQKVQIGGKFISVDSQLEKINILQLDANGFRDKWDCRNSGIRSGRFGYTPDIYLSVDVDNESLLGIVEVKPLTSFFTKEIRENMVAASRYYPKSKLYLYVYKPRQWYEIDKKTKKLIKCIAPKPGKLLIAEVLPSDFAIPWLGKFGRVYWSRPLMALARAVLVSLETILALITKRKK